MLEAFGQEEQVEAFGETLTLRADFHAATVIEGALDLPFPVVAAHVRSGAVQYRVLSNVIWAFLRHHHREIKIEQVFAMVMARGEDAAKMGFALDALLERCFPSAREDRKTKNPPKRNGRSKSSAAGG